MRKIANSPVITAILFLVVIFLFRSNYNIYKKNQIAKINREESDKRLALLEEKAGRLNSEIERLKTERGIEEELRSKFQITRDGEKVLVVVDEEIQNEVSGGSTEAEGGYWQEFKSLFGL